MGAKSASAVLSRFGRLEAIPPNPQDWHVNISNLKGLSEVFNSKRELAFLFRDLATLRTDLPLFGLTLVFLKRRLDHSISSGGQDVKSLSRRRPGRCERFRMRVAADSCVADQQ
jgi:hypothetical protein